MLIDQLNSTAKIELIKLLINLDVAICFRDIISLTNLGLRSVQCALSDFEKFKIIKIKIKNKKKMYRINDLEEIKELRKFINYQEMQNIKLRAKSYNSQGKDLLQDLTDLVKFANYLDLTKANVRS